MFSEFVEFQIKLNMSLINIFRYALNQTSITKLGLSASSQRWCSSQANDDMPDPTISNPYLKEKPQCLLCRYNITVDYKNVRLLSQFVSPFTGRLYDKHITGLCEKQHRTLKMELIRARQFGLMSPYYVDPKYSKDPKLFDPTKPQRANPY